MAYQAPQGNIINLDSESEDEGRFNFEDYVNLIGDQIEDRGEEFNFSYAPLTVCARGPPEVYESCLQSILEVFPDISHDHVRKIYDARVEAMERHQTISETLGPLLIGQILDKGAYPKQKERNKERKRKRPDRTSDDEEEERWKLTGMEQGGTHARLYVKISTAALRESFPLVPHKYVVDRLKEHKSFYNTYFVIEGAVRTYDAANISPFLYLRKKRSSFTEFHTDIMASAQRDGHDFEDLKKEIDAAKERQKKADRKRKLEFDATKAAEAKEEEHRRKGEVVECGCCFDTVTLSRVTNCNGDVPHFFCHDCAQNNAKNDIGYSRYGLRCMDGSGCEATFSRSERRIFLDAKTIETLDRLQQQEEIRRADLEGLARCPFCDFAAICPPAEVDKEFHCNNSECEEVSCRLCNLKTHIPLTCRESKKENGLSERRIIEEARTEALIRICHKCKVRIIKEDGCNKVMCTTCHAVLCDYCGKDISSTLYNHFNGQGREPRHAGRENTGKCPLYDESGNKRKEEQIEKAGNQAMEKVREENPQLSEEDLKIKFAKCVLPSDQTTRTDAYHAHLPLPGLVRMGIPRFYEPDAARIRDLRNELDVQLNVMGDRPGRPHRNMGEQFGIHPPPEQAQRLHQQRQQDFRHQQMAKGKHSTQLHAQQAAERHALTKQAINQGFHSAKDQRDNLMAVAHAYRRPIPPAYPVLPPDIPQFPSDAPFMPLVDHGQPPEQLPGGFEHGRPRQPAVERPLVRNDVLNPIIRSRNPFASPRPSHFQGTPRRGPDNSNVRPQAADPWLANDPVFNFAGGPNREDQFSGVTEEDELNLFW